MPVFFYALGLQVQRAGDAAPKPEPGALPSEHTELSTLASLEELFDRTPDVRGLHKYAQASLLNAIQRLADGSTDAAEVETLAQAYLTLPSPDEDDPAP
jgi:hypothetical protein